MTFSQLCSATCAFVLALSMSGCADSDDPNNRRPKVAISLLVDLSETWHNAANDSLNRRVLTTVGNSIAGASNQLPKPISIRFHAIGDESLGREPICSATYRPSAFALRAAQADLITEREKFHRYVAIDCPEMLIALPVEGSTEIAAAIITADRALQLTKKGADRLFVILSDFKEESPVDIDFRGVDLTGSRFLLIYRTLDEDRAAPAEQKSKLRAWDRRLSNLGATVQVIDENAVLSSPKDFESFLKAFPSD